MQFELINNDDTKLINQLKKLGIKLITYKTLNKIKKQTNNNFFLLFFAPWCEHCHKILPTFIDKTNTSKKNLFAIDCSNILNAYNRKFIFSLQHSYHISGYPEIVQIHNDTVTNRYSGSKPILKYLNSL
tara:strand:- start:685 stop:1071 length:387 start_codon:yes stop_codon:yes gene_type:complete